MTKEQKLKLQISRDGLREPNRSRDYNYKRIIIASQLHPMLSYTDIGREMNRNHATVINMVRNYKSLVKYKDFRKYRDEYLNEILGETKGYSLKKRVLLCDDYWQMRKLQEELKKDLQ